MITDSHCHLGADRFSEEEVGGIIEAAVAAGVGRMVTLATCLGDVERNLNIASNEHVWAGIGIHPCEVHEAPDDAVERLRGYAGDGRVCVIGETGLDYFHEAPAGWVEAEFRKRQRSFLHQHFELAAEVGLNVVIHTRDREGCGSFEDALGIYRKYSDRVRAVFHCFSLGWMEAEKVWAEGGLVSFGGVVTFRNAELIKETVRRCAKRSFMLETDAPYLAPEPVRGRRNVPEFTMHTARAIAEIRGETLEELAGHTEGAVEFFKMNRCDLNKTGDDSRFRG